jgi:hypothetical protein
VKREERRGRSEWGRVERREKRDERRESREKRE